jgi:hypothetical protein
LIDQERNNADNPEKIIAPAKNQGNLCLLLFAFSSKKSEKRSEKGPNNAALTFRSSLIFVTIMKV